MKHFSFFLGCSVFLLAGCTLAGTGSPAPETTPIDEEQVDSAMPVPGEEDVEEMEVIEEDEETSTTEDAGGNGGIAARVVSVTASNWVFTPNAITAKKGESLTLRVFGQEGTHGFSVPGLGINQTVIMGNTASVAIPTDTPGTYEFRCSVPCGSGHKDMKGTIVITE